MRPGGGESTAAAVLCPFHRTEVEDDKEGERGDMQALGVSGRGRG